MHVIFDKMDKERLLIDYLIIRLIFKGCRVLYLFYLFLSPLFLRMKRGRRIYLFIYLLFGEKNSKKRVRGFSRKKRKGRVGGLEREKRGRVGLSGFVNKKGKGKRKGKGKCKNAFNCACEKKGS